MAGDDAALTQDEGSPAQRGQLRPAIIVVIAVVAVFALLFGWRMWRNSAPPPPAPPPTAVVAAVVTPMTVPASLDAVGSLRAVREVTLAPEVAGRITSIGFTGGQYVGAGATVIRLFDAPERADRAAAAAKAEVMRLLLARARQLVPTGAESREVLQQRQGDYDQAIAAVHQLDARLVQKRVAAPFAGQIGVRQVNLGQYVNPGDTIATLTALDQLFVDFSLPQQELSKLQPGSEVRVTTDAWPGRTFTARVTTVEPRVDAQSRNVWVQAALANPDKALRPGMYITAALTLAPISNALVVPLTAIVTSAQGESVIAVRGANARKEGKAEPVAVQTGRRLGNSVVVTSGLKPGDVVVTEGQLRIQPGANLRVGKLIPAVAD